MFEIVTSKWQEVSHGKKINVYVLIPHCYIDISSRKIILLMLIIIIINTQYSYPLISNILFVCV